MAVHVPHPEACWRPPVIKAVALTCAGLLALLPACAQEAFPQIHLADIGQAAGLSQVADGLAVGGYELADGNWQSFGDWYHTDWPEMHVDVLAQMSDSFGLLVGLGSGEGGQKYSIDPSFRLGLIGQMKPSANSTLTLVVNGILGGQFREKTCVADYGIIGGTQEVNCRLAATHLPPEETLQYLAFAEPTRLRLTLNFRANF
jgi:hypothetical protein